MKDISAFPNYSITKNGCIWSKPRQGSGWSKKGKWLKPVKINNGYLKVTLCKNKKHYDKSIHRLVLETYIGKCSKGMEACHNDGNRQNNRLSNLRWDTKSNNQQDAIKQGKTIGENNPNHKLTISDVRMIIYMQKTRLFTQREIADIYDVSASVVWSIIHRKKWKHIWKNRKISLDFG